ncbi:hypothetical protein [Mucilaginibacter pedocola]|uniref:Uncharacterized protein n=1 Tax=Mucilaginibacter pedocola TaxID=1792845 RepID=A0A1S9P8J1_9SPHI|nr:hypothetical protein [Mucilaginibacter pedocola]OOQ56958.1 hypothetical protein BC343_15560 [Mucilaginibacter pedocola]
MRSKLFHEKPTNAQTSTGRWLRILPDTGEGYALYDAMQEANVGRILFDADDNWIYDGTVLDVYEQEEVAGIIGGHQKEMDQLLKTL